MLKTVTHITNCVKYWLCILCPPWLKEPKRVVIDWLYITLLMINQLWYKGYVITWLHGERVCLGNAKRGRTGGGGAWFQQLIFVWIAARKCLRKGSWTERKYSCWSLSGNLKAWNQCNREPEKAARTSSTCFRTLGVPPRDIHYAVIQTELLTDCSRYLDCFCF
jgi:hypothetical protein